MRERVSRVPLVGGRRGKATTGSDGRSILLPSSFRTISVKAVTLHDRNVSFAALISIDLYQQIVFSNYSYEKRFQGLEGYYMFFVTILFHLDSTIL